MKTYKYIKQDGSVWLFYYDNNIKYWTVIEIDALGNQISIEADHYHDKKQMIDDHGFNFKTLDHGIN